MKADEIARALAERAEAVCRAYLPAGRRQGAYWHVGNVHGHPGQSLYVRLTGPQAGHWTDAATSEYGDLLDLIAANRGLDFWGAVEEAHIFLRQPWPAPSPTPHEGSDTRAAARRLFAASKPMAGTLAERYLAGRGIVLPRPEPALRFHPRAWCRTTPDASPESRPALIAAVTDADGTVTGVQRTFLDPVSVGKASIATPRRALGHLRGNAVRFGASGPALVAGEGIETVLTLRMLLPGLPMVAALSAAHLGAFEPLSTLTRLYVAIEPDPAGESAFARLADRAGARGIAVRPLLSRHADLNADLLALGPDVTAAQVRRQLDPADRDRTRAA
ncbi:DUF7146 domain-containing protein [Roseospira visakhapatnamensis]|uniref:Toprim domain-containing protein n=1 Tax=Roseospira visakhapatnamensis TaxID=390880 RepID=A0A7W6RG37_9PROT|nr:toprim domain-containing protein [Roseospira visakhapatnamensis]MBB4267926.1 hypothetical protein [Roseospira visakhapatnamensis]